MQTEVITSFVSGCVLGATAGFSPGPLLTLVISETLTGGTRAGMRVACAPLITDLPIIALCVGALATVAGSTAILGAVSLGGAAFLLFLARQTWHARPPALDGPPVRSRSLLKGIATNLLSPHPYLFWIAVGAPILVQGWQNGPAAPALFLAGFYLALIGAKLGVAALVGRSRSFLAGRAYRALLRSLAVALAVFAAFFVRDGLLLLAGKTL